VFATAVLAVTLALAAPARAETLTVGLFAPSAPFDGVGARVDYATKLATHLGKAIGADGAGKVYGRAGEFAAAVKKGEVQVALVDAAYLAAAGGGTVIAASVRNGEANRGWQIVARGDVADVKALQGKTLLVPSVGGREADFVLNALFGGDLVKGYFAGITASPDTASALAALGLGRADAAVVPADASLPAGVSRVSSLPPVPGPMLVVYGTITADRRAALVAAARAFDGDQAVPGFTADDGDLVRALARKLTAAPKRGPMAVPGVRLLVGDLVVERALVIEPTDPRRYVAPIDPPK
jgi:hypothetical protein